MLLKYEKTSFERTEHRLRHLRGLACIKGVLEGYALANDVGLQVGDVPAGLGKMLVFLSAIHGCGTGGLRDIGPRRGAA
jgi:hypothetical protein